MRSRARVFGLILALLFAPGTGGAVEVEGQEAVPVSLGILIDAGAEMGRFMDKAIEGIELVLDNLDATDEVFVLSFARTTGVVHEMSTDTADIPAAIGRVATGGWITLYTALELALEKLDAARHERRAIILVTNGQIVGLDLARSREAIRQSDVIVYGVGMPRPEAPSNTAASAGRNAPGPAGRSQAAGRFDATVIAEIALKSFAEDSGGAYGVVPQIGNRMSRYTVKPVFQAILERLKLRD